MPFSYQPSTAPPRTRRPRDKDGHREPRNNPSGGGGSSSSSGRRAKESTSRNRTPPHSLRPAQPSLYTQQNLTLDQLPALPASGTGSPSSCSPVLRAHPSTLAPSTNTTPTAAVPALSGAQFHTPAALQPYLESEDEEPSFDPASEPRVSPTQKGPSQLDPSSPKLVSEPLQSPTSDPRRTPSPQPVETAVLRPVSPPPPASSPFWNQPHPGPGTYDPTQAFSQNLPFVGSPPQFAPAPPYLTGAREHYYAPPPYGGPQYMTMAQPVGSIHNPQPAPHSIPYYHSYASQSQMPPPFQVVPNASARGRSSTSSRRSFSGEPFPNDLQSLARGPEQSTQPGGLTACPQASEDDAVELLQRIQSAIPDLHLLLNRYKETSGQLGVRETLIRETEAQKAAALEQKEAHIEKLILELEALSSKHSAESSKLRLEIGNMEEKQKELQDHLQMEKKARDDLESRNHALQEQKEQAERTIQELKLSMDRQSAVWKETSQSYSAQQTSLEGELQSVKRECQARLQTQESEMKESWAQERAALQAEWLRQKRDLEESHARLRREWEMALESRQKAVEESHRKQLQDKTAWDKERESLTHDWDQERAILGKGSEEQRKILGAQFEKEKEDMQKKWQSSQARANKQAEEAQAKLQKEIDRLKAGWDADKSKFAKATAELRNAIVKLNEDNTNLQKLAEAFGDITDLKSREDPFYDEAFSQLHKQIVDLSAEHFQDAIDTIPREIAIRIPEKMLSYLSSSDGSARVRAAYIEHIISTVITRRVFKPFLFTLSLRHRSTDQLFQSWSDHMRSKSTRKEALWRQRTLHAAYTVSSAKQTINKVAGAIVDEIIDAIKLFAHHARLEQITRAVRRIVKTAAETWRYARLEIPMITASMSEEERPCYMKSEINHGLAHADDDTPHRSRQVLLPLFPIIEREAIHEGIRKDSKIHDEGYTYFPGRMLYVDDPEVITSFNAADHPQASMTGRHCSGSEHEIENQISIPSSGKERLWIGTSMSPPKCSARDGEFADTACTSMRSDIRGIVKPGASSGTQVDYDPRTKASARSHSIPPPLSQSSATSGSSTGNSSSTTRAGDLPDWESKGPGIVA